jgi:tRNA pseudouridine38-40 synthase
METSLPSATRRLKLTIAYDGAPWTGWQTLPSGLTVQDQVERVLQKISDGPVRIHGSGRTDTGVHALGQVAHVDVPVSCSLTDDHWPHALNALLPPSIRVLLVETVSNEFHARYDAKAKVYRYRIWRRRVMSPFEMRRAWHVYGPLDEEGLGKCARLLVGTHNFSRLSVNRGHVSEKERRENPADVTRTLSRVEMHVGDDTIEIEIEGDGFLYKMVRLIVGSLFHVARGGETTQWFASLLADPSGLKSHLMAPADGLYLVRVIY